MCSKFVFAMEHLNTSSSSNTRSYTRGILIKRIRCFNERGSRVSKDFSTELCHSSKIVFRIDQFCNFIR